MKRFCVTYPNGGRVRRVTVDHVGGHVFLLDDLVRHVRLAKEAQRSERERGRERECSSRSLKETGAYWRRKYITKQGGIAINRGRMRCSAESNVFRVGKYGRAGAGAGIEDKGRPRVMECRHERYSYPPKLKTGSSDATLSIRIPVWFRSSRYPRQVEAMDAAGAINQPWSQTFFDPFRNGAPPMEPLVAGQGDKGPLCVTGM